MEHVAVTGMGIVSPVGSGVRFSWRHLLEARRAIAPIAGASRLSGNGLWAAVPDFLASSALPRAALRNTDRFTQYAMAAAAEALDHARLDPPETRTAIVIGNTMGGFSTVAQAQSRFAADAHSVTCTADASRSSRRSRDISGTAWGAPARCARSRGSPACTTTRFRRRMGTRRVDPATRFDLVMRQPRTRSYSAFQVNAFGFGGQNASLIVSL